MSRIGRLPITIPTGVTVAINNRVVTVSGSAGTTTLALPLKINVEVKDNTVLVTRLSEDKKVRSCHGAIRAEINNMILGLQKPWSKTMEIRGTGYKFQGGANKLTILAGYIHPVNITAPEGVTFQVPEETKCIIIGIDKVKVGQTASNIRKVRPPEPYKGKGIRYLDEFIKLKAGKTAKA